WLRARATTSARSGANDECVRFAPTSITTARESEPHPDLQALDDFLDRSGEGQAEAREIGLVQDDAHVLLRPGHPRQFGAVVHRPVLPAAVRERVAQLFRIDAHGLAELQALVVRRDAGPQEEVVDHLADLSRAGGAQVEDV